MSEKKCKGKVKLEDVTTRPCKLPPKKGRGGCNKHLKNRPIGTAHWNWQHGKFSKDLPANIVERYHKFLEAWPKTYALSVATELRTRSESQTKRKYAYR